MCIKICLFAEWSCWSGAHAGVKCERTTQANEAITHTHTHTHNSVYKINPFLFLLAVVFFVVSIILFSHDADDDTTTKKAIQEM